MNTDNHKVSKVHVSQFVEYRMANRLGTRWLDKLCICIFKYWLNDHVYHCLQIQARAVTPNPSFSPLPFPPTGPREAPWRPEMVRTSTSRWADDCGTAGARFPPFFSRAFPWRESIVCSSAFSSPDVTGPREKRWTSLIVFVWPWGQMVWLFECVNRLI